MILRDAGQVSLTNELGDLTEGSSVEKKYRLAVGRTVHLADVFTNTDDRQGCRSIIKRLVENIFGYMFHTPTFDETAMGIAFASSIGTASLSRRVGACIVKDEQVCAIGCNEVPKFGGGTYHAESYPDHREFNQTGDPNDKIKAKILSDLLLRLKNTKTWLSKEKQETPVEDLLNEVLKDSSLRESAILDVIEYTRSAHAEAVAITSAAARGVSIQGSTLYTTTLPCHECTRLIVAAGIRRVVYIEPYPKSRGSELQSDSVILGSYGQMPQKVLFQPFAGIAIHRQPDLFSWVDRKVDDYLSQDEGSFPTLSGAPVAWTARDSTVRDSIFDPEFAEAEIFAQLYKESRSLDGLDQPGQHLGNESTQRETGASNIAERIH
jgi:cytidine deaminase